MSLHLAYLVLGSNLGNRSTNLENAKTEIRALSETKILKESEIYKSPAYGPIDQPFFFQSCFGSRNKVLAFGAS